MPSVESNVAPCPRERLEGYEAGFLGHLESLRPELLRFTCWLARDRSVAEDIVQETLLRAWRARATLQDRSATRSWLLTIARHEHARLYERKRLDLVSLDDLPDGHSIGFDRVVAGTRTGSELEDLREAVLKLPVGYREPLVMQVLGGFTTAEIARELGLSLTAVLTRLFRARNTLRKLLEAEPEAGEPRSVSHQPAPTYPTPPRTASHPKHDKFVARRSIDGAKNRLNLAPISSQVQ